MPAISVAFNLPGAGFVLLPAGAKAPPLRTGWQNGAWSFTEAERHEGNVGIVAGNGLIVLDQDDMAAFKEIEIPLTMDWETRPGRMAQLFICDDVAATLAARKIRFDQAQVFLFRNGEHVGELKLQRAYQVIPTSWKTLEDGTKAEYRLIHETPPASISLKRLLEKLERIGISISESKNPATQKLRDLEKSAHRKRVETDDQRARKYAEAALRAEVNTLASTPEGGRNNQLNKSAFSLGQFVAAGMLSESEVLRDLSQAASYAGLRPEEIDRTIKSGLDSGAIHPREMPEPTRTTALPQVSYEIKEKALEIMQHGDPVSFILDTLAAYHAGDRRSAELLLCSVAIGSILNANGTQPKLSGGSGKGKTHLCKALRHLMPPEWVLFTSLSPKAIYYDPNIKPGMVIFSDDVRISEELEDTLKRAMSNFQEPSPYRVLNKDRKLETRYLPERLIWWLTSVQDDQEEQLVNRFFSVGVDESEKQDKDALKHTFTPLAEGRREFPITESVQVCREIIREIKSHTWMVKAPFLVDGEGNLNILWQSPEDRRNPGRFVDLLAAYAVLRSSQREIMDQGGYTLVIAISEDFQAAKDLYESRAENLTTKLTDGELHFIRWLEERAGKSIFEFKINNIAKEYRGADGKGLSPKSLERMLLGRKDRNAYGLLDRIRGGGITVELVSDRYTRYNLFSFDPNQFNLLESYADMVSLKTIAKGPDPTRPYKTQPNGSSPKTPPDDDNDKIIDRIDPLYPGGIEKGGQNSSGRNGREKDHLSLWSGYSGSNGTEPSQDIDFDRSSVGSGGGSEGLRTGEEPPGEELEPAGEIDASLLTQLSAEAKAARPVMPFAFGTKHEIGPSVVLQAVKSLGWAYRRIDDGLRSYDAWLPAEAWARWEASA